MLACLDAVRRAPACCGHVLFNVGSIWRVAPVCGRGPIKLSCRVYLPRAAVTRVPSPRLRGRRAASAAVAVAVVAAGSAGGRPRSSPLRSRAVPKRQVTRRTTWPFVVIRSKSRRRSPAPSPARSPPPPAPTHAHSRTRMRAPVPRCMPWPLCMRGRRRRCELVVPQPEAGRRGAWWVSRRGDFLKGQKRKKRKTLLAPKTVTSADGEEEEEEEEEEKEKEEEEEEEDAEDVDDTGGQRTTHNAQHPSRQVRRAHCGETAIRRQNARTTARL